MDKCMTAINLYSGMNSGYYTPTATKIKGFTGWFMINENGSLFCEVRVIEEGEKQFRIEYMTNSAWNEFENNYCGFLGI